MYFVLPFFFSSRRRHTRSTRDWSSDVCSSDLLVERAETHGHVTTAVQWARRAAQLEPNDEPAVRRLIVVLDHHGERAGALAAYEAFAARLAADYEAEPAAETQALVAAVRARERATPSAS